MHSLLHHCPDLGSLSKFSFGLQKQISGLRRARVFESRFGPQNEAIYKSAPDNSSVTRLLLCLG